MTKLPASSFMPQDLQNTLMTPQTAPVPSPRRPSGIEEQLQQPERADQLKTKAIFSLHEVLAKHKDDANAVTLTKPAKLLSQTVQFGEINIQISINEVKKS
jgi:hypothetical protein